LADSGELLGPTVAALEENAFTFLDKAVMKLDKHKGTEG